MGEVDPNGNLTTEATYDVYGNARNRVGTPTSKQAWLGGLGHTTEPETGLVYMRARYYDPGTGRFTSEDPNYNGVNWFAYCNGNPVNFVDQSGQITAGIALLIVVVLAIIVIALLHGYEMAKKGKEIQKSIDQNNQANPMEHDYNPPAPPGCTIENLPGDKCGQATDDLVHDGDYSIDGFSTGEGVYLAGLISTSTSNDPSLV